VRRLIYSMGVSLDGYIAGRNGEIDWSAPDEELHRFHNEQAGQTGLYLFGRRLYEVMTYWDTAEETLPPEEEVEREFARIYKQTPKLVVSSSLTEVKGNARLLTGDLAEEVERLKAQPCKDLAVGGAGLAASLIERGLVDEYRLFISPVALGGGTPYFPPLERRLELELVESRTFGSRVLYVRYRSLLERASQ
jgi:dihydrofolate reductase